MGVALCLVALCAAPASAGLETVLQDDAQLLHRPEPQLRRSLEEMRLLGVDRIRVTAGWSVLTRDADAEQRPANFDATDPRAYEQERWYNLDRLLVLAREYGFKTMVDIAFWAPHWAAGDPAGERGRAVQSPKDFADFAMAVARRYSGGFMLDRTVAASRGPFGGRPSRDAQYLSANFGTSNPEAPGAPTLRDALGLAGLLGHEERGSDAVDAALGTATSPPTAPLPKVDLVTLWNEPNHAGFLRPQWHKRGRQWLPRSPHVYREMVHQGYAAIKAVRPDMAVLVGGTAAYGSYAGTGTGNVPPLRFLRELACVDERLRPLRRSGCRHFKPIPGDGWSHHPYTMRTEPDAPARPGRVDDVPLSAMPKLAAAIDALVKRGRLAPGLRNLWITEYGYETNPPVAGHPYTPGDQARFLPWAEYLAQRVPTVRSFAQFLLRDLPPSAFRVGKSKQRPFGQWQSGLLFEDGTPKIGAYAFRTGLFVRQSRSGHLTLFGRLRLGPGPREVRIERRPPGTTAWRVVPTKAPGATAPARSFTADGRQAFLRFGFGTRGDGWRYRVLYREGGTWRGQTVPSVAPVRR